MQVWFTRVMSVGLFLAIAASSSALGQQTTDKPISRENLYSNYLQENAEQVAKILRLSATMGKLRSLQQNRSCESAPTTEELSLRQDVLETVIWASFNVDAVLAEIDNERAQLMEMRAGLQNRRDHAVNLLNVANLVTGTGIGIAVNALQFSDSTQNVGNALGVGSGIASTVLSIVGIHKQRGPITGIGRTPNMLAPLFGKEPVLSTYYPPSVFEYLQSVPPAAPEQGARLDQLKTAWIQEGRTLPVGAPKSEGKLTVLTTSQNPKLKISIDDLTDRIAMLTDVSGRVSLMKRDLGELMMSMRKAGGCQAQ